MSWSYSLTHFLQYAGFPNHIYYQSAWTYYFRSSSNHWISASTRRCDQNPTLPIFWQDRQHRLQQLKVDWRCATFTMGCVWGLSNGVRLFWRERKLEESDQWWYHWWKHTCVTGNSGAPTNVSKCIKGETHYQSRVLAESNSLFFFYKALRRLVSKRKSGRTNPPPPSLAKAAKCGKRARANLPSWSDEFLHSLFLWSIYQS